MKFVKQWSSEQRPYTSVESKSMTVPNMALPLSTIISRIAQGNMFGVSMHQVSYDDDNVDHDSPFVAVDPADPIGSAFEIKEDFKNLKQRAKDAVKASLKAVKESKDSKKPEPEPVTV